MKSSIFKETKFRDSQKSDSNKINKENKNDVIVFMNNESDKSFFSNNANFIINSSLQKQNDNVNKLEDNSIIHSSRFKDDKSIILDRICLDSNKVVNQIEKNDQDYSHASSIVDETRSCLQSNKENTSRTKVSKKREHSKMNHSNISKSSKRSKNSSKTKKNISNKSQITKKGNYFEELRQKKISSKNNVKAANKDLIRYNIMSQAKEEHVFKNLDFFDEDFCKKPYYLRDQDFNKKKEYHLKEVVIEKSKINFPINKEVNLNNTVLVKSIEQYNKNEFSRNNDNNINELMSKSNIDSIIEKLDKINSIPKDFKDTSGLEIKNVFRKNDKKLINGIGCNSIYSVFINKFHNVPSKRINIDKVKNKEAYCRNIFEDKLLYNDFNGSDNKGKINNPFYYKFKNLKENKQAKTSKNIYEQIFNDKRIEKY